MAFARRLLALLTWRRLGLTIAISALLPLTGIYVTMLDWTIARYVLLLPWFLGFGALVMLCMSCAEAASPSRPVPTTWYVASVLVAGAISAGAGAALAPTLRASIISQSASVINQRSAMGRPPGSVPLAMSLIAGIHVAFYGLFVVLTHSRLQRVRQAARVLSEAEIAREEAQRQATTARLAAARVAVDPAAVIARLEAIERRYDYDLAAADTMLDELIAQLRASIPRVREARARLAP